MSTVEQQLMAKLKDGLKAIAKLKEENRALQMARSEPIAIVGIGCRFPGGAGAEQFWQLLSAGNEAVIEVPADRWNLNDYYDPDPAAAGKMYVRRGGFLEGIDQFDPGFFGIAPREAVSLDPQQRLLLETAWEALEHAGLAADRLAGSRGGVFVGLCGSEYVQHLLADGDGAVDAYLGTGTALSVAAGRLNYLLGWQGPSLAIDTACSSSLVTIHQASRSLQWGECDIALAGGVSLMLSPVATINFCKARMLAPDGRCKTFDAAADGYVRGEGCGLVVLKRLRDAERDGDHILAVLRGSAVNQDGRSGGLTVPNGSAQQAVIRDALAAAAVAPADVGYVETHGTGTSLGDPIEVQALAAVLGEGRSPESPVWLGSVKTNIGHLEAAAGVAGIIKVVLALQHEHIPPHLNFHTPNPHIPWDKLPVKVTTGMPWKRGAASRIAGVSSFSFSGTNAHAILEEAPARAEPSNAVDRPLHVLTISAKTEAALAELARRYESDLDDAFADACFTANTGRSQFEHRLALVAPNGADARARLASSAAGQETPGLFRGRADGKSRPRIAFLFTGQGSQYAGMGRRLFQTQPTFRKTLLHCESVLAPFLPRPLTEVLFEDTGLLDRTEFTQPALFALEYALARLWQSWGIHPDMVLGHSVGEYVAACVAGVWSLEDGLTLIAERGRLMGGLPAGGAMAAVRADPARVRAAVESLAGQVSLAALNGPANTVISGDAAAVESVRSMLQQQGISSLPLAVSHAFHSHRLEPMLPEFERIVAARRHAPPQVRMISNLSGRQSDGSLDAAYWREHARHPVRFADGMRTLAECDCKIFLEIGPHPVLTAMARQCLPDGEHTWLASLQRGADDSQSMLASLAQLHVAGAAVDWAGFDQDYARRKVDLPTYPFQRERYWTASSREPGASTRLGKRPDIHEWLYEVAWEPRSGTAMPANYIPGPQELVHQLEVRAGEILSGVATTYRELLPNLDALAVDYIVAALRQLPINGEPCCRLSPRKLAEFGVIERHRRLAGRLLEILGEEGLLKPAGTDWELREALPNVSPRERLALLLEQNPETRVEALFLGRCGEQLTAVLRGEVEPLPLLFPTNGEQLAEKIYGDAPGTQAFNALAAETLAKAAERLPANRRLRVLEIGAGTGGTTASVLPLLPTDRTDYVFTDISAAFLAPAREKFARHDFVDYRVLDIERDPAAQGWTSHEFDVVLAANVLHATADLRRELGHIRRLLAPSGLLVLVEGTRRQRWIDLTFGLLEGWWKFTDTQLRPTHPLLSAQAWQRLLGEEGFEDAACLPADDSVGQAIVLARNPAPTRAPALAPVRRCLVFMDDRGVGNALAELLENSGGACVRVERGARFERRAAGCYGIDQRQPSSFDELLRDVGAASEPLDDVVYLCGQPTDEAPGSSCGAVLHLVQALTRAGARRLPRLLLVTESAQAVVPTDGIDALWLSPIWGLAHGIAREHPELRCRCIDLDPAATPAQSAQQLIDELAEADAEERVAYRGAQRLVARLVRSSRRAAKPIELHANATYLITGGLGGLGLLTARWLTEHGARHLALVSRGAPNEEALRTIALIEQAGSTVRALSADVSQSREVTRVLDEIARTQPPLRGVIHAASGLDDDVLLNHTLERFENSIAAKVMGAWHLHLLTQGLPLDFFVMYSSAISLLGAAGQGGYAAANAFLDALARHRQTLCLPGLSINWGVWSQVGIAARGNVPQFLAEQGLGTIDPASGLAALEQVMGMETAQVAVLPADWPQMLRKAPHLGLFLSRLEKERRPDSPQRLPAAPSNVLAARLRDAAPVERHALLIQYVQSQVARVLDLRPGQLPDRRTGFFDIGLDSLMAVELRGRLQADLGGLALSSTAVLDYPTVEALALHLAEKLDLSSVPASPRIEPRSDFNEPIAIVGLGCRFPGGENPEEFWQLLEQGRDAVRDIPPERWDVDAFYDPDPDAPGKMYARQAGLVEQLDRFDPRFFGIAPREAIGLDPQQRLLLEVTWEALERAGIPADKLAGGRTGVYLGICGSGYGGLLAQRGREAIDAYLGTGTSPAAAAGRLSYVFGLQGPCVAIDTACSSSLVAVSQACDALRAGRCDAALAGGVNAIVMPDWMIAGCKGRMLSPTGRCKTFDARADGFAPGEGCGMVVLKRLSDARRDGDTIFALIRGSAVNQDGRSGGLTVPNGPAQQAVVREALASGSVDALDVNYVEAHGTGTSLGDPIEVQALAAALGAGRSEANPLLIGAVKTNIGHLEAAAGIAGLIKVVLALQHELIPRHLNLTTPNPHIPWETLPVKVTVEPTPWPRGSSRRISGVSSFGFSGTNAHVLLEEAPIEAKVSGVERPLHVLCVSARTEPALRELAGRCEKHLVASADSFADLSFTANAGRSHFEHRLAIVADSAAAAREQLEAAIARTESRWVRGTVDTRNQFKVAFYFPGEFHERLGMGQSLFRTQPTFAKVLKDCEARLKPDLPRLLTEILFEETGFLGRPEVAPPALFALEYSLARLWQSWGILPDVVLGQGVGELVAACVAGVFALEDGLKLVAEFGRLMAAPSESMQAQFQRLAATIDYARPRVGLFANRHGRPFAAEEVPDASYWCEPNRPPLRAEAFQALAANGCRTVLEVGPLSLSAHPNDLGILGSLRPDADDWVTMLASLAQLYVTGAAVDWAGFDRDYSRRRVRLPTYPFQRQRYWVDIVPRPSESIADSFYETAWVPASAEVSATPPGNCLFLTDEAIIGARLVEILQGQGWSCRQHSAAALVGADPDTISALLRLDEGPTPTEVVYLANVDEIDAATAAERETLVVLQLVQALVRQSTSARLRVVTRGAQAVRAGENVCPDQTALWGLARVIALEHPRISGGLVDLPRDADTAIAEALALALSATDGEDQALRDGGRFVPRLRRAQVEMQSLRLPEAATYLISGGLGALGLLTARRLVERGARHLVLLGRTAASGVASAGVALAIREMEDLGATIHVWTVDVSERGALEEALHKLAPLPPLRGVFHLAGVLDDGVLINQTADRLARVFASKVRGAHNLDELTRNLPLDHFVLFSSAAAVFGSAGQGIYTAANAFLNGLAARRRSEGLPALSINWGPWAEAGMAADASRRDARRWEKLGMQELPPAHGLAALEALLQSGQGQATVLRADWNKVEAVGRAWPFLTDLAKGTAEPKLRERLEQTLPVRRAELIAGHVRATVARVLGLEPAALTEHTGFFDLGMDSLMAVELHNRLQADLDGTMLGSTLVFDHPTVAALTRHLAEKLLDPPAAELNSSLTSLSADLEQLSADDLLQLVDLKASQFLGKDSRS